MTATGATPRRPAGERVIFHLDMDAFFAAVEERDNPQIRGLPLAVVGAGQRTVIVTASYAARSLGVHVGMNSYEGLKQCPQLLLIVGDHHKYTAASTQIMDILSAYTPQVEPFSIDEAFLDLTGCGELFGPPETIAAKIKAQIQAQVGLTASIGIAPNKLLAKLASKLDKPDGLYRVYPADVAKLLESTPIGALCGIGLRTAAKLNSFGVLTCGELGRLSVDFLCSHFGVTGQQLQQMGQGVDSSPVALFGHREPVKSVGHSRTYPQDICDPQQQAAALLELAQMVGRRLRRYGFCGRTLALTIRYHDFQTVTRRKTLQHPICHDNDIYQLAQELWVRHGSGRPVRLLGISLANLVQGAGQLSLLPDERRSDLLSAAVDAVAARWGKQAITYAALLGRPQAHEVISPSWRPGGIRDHIQGSTGEPSPEEDDT